MKPKTFFEELRLVTLSGAYADPLYNGSNRDMKGWEMKKFPGSYMSYANEIEQDGFVELKCKLPLLIYHTNGLVKETNEMDETLDK